MKSVTIDNVEIVLSAPTCVSAEWVGQAEPLRQLLACWLTVAPEDLPLTPRILGVPGVGKTTLAMAAAARRKQQVFIMQCTSDTRPEDLIITPVLSSQGRISYHASPLLSAVITGGIAVLDEGNRMPEKSWASLASLFDNRRMVESVVAGITIKAHPEFRAVVTMNEDSSTFEIPDYIMSRLQPAIELSHPSREDELTILQYNLPFSPLEVLNLCVDFLQRAHNLDLPYSVRDGINIVRYVLKQRQTDPHSPTEDILRLAIKHVLGEEALDLDALAEKRRLAGEPIPGMNLGDFFFGDDDPMNPDSEREPER